MIHLIVQASKYLMILLFLYDVFLSFFVFRFQESKDSRKRIYRQQRRIMWIIVTDGFLVLFATAEEEPFGIALIYGGLIAVFAVLYLVYHLFYRRSSELLLNNMCMLLGIGMIMITRIDRDKALRQLIFIAVGTAAILLIPLILSRLSLFRKLTWFYGIAGILGLAAVLAAGSVSYGAKLSLTVAGFTLQPSEFVKLLFVFFIAGLMYRRNDMNRTILTSICAALFVLILVASKDLGGALLYFFTYLVMIYAATGLFRYFLGGTAFMGLASLAGYKLFSHVRNRVIAWKDPLAVYDNQGYQVSQSLFAIGTGSWFGLGLNQGLPGKIPVVEKDFIFAMIVEEMGGVFGLCLIMLCVSCFLMIFNIAMQLKDGFYKLVALGLGTTYALQIFLTIGGVTKFIPSTGVTLPLVAYGGSSLLSTMLLFGIIQGLYIRQAREAEARKQQEKIREKEMQNERS